MYSLIYRVQFDLQCIVWFTEYSLIYSVQFDLQCIVWFTVYSLIYSVQFDLQRTVWFTMYSLIYSVQCTVWFTVYNVQFDLQCIVCFKLNYFCFSQLLNPWLSKYDKGVANLSHQLYKHALHQAFSCSRWRCFRLRQDRYTVLNLI